MTTVEGRPETEGEIQERIDDIESDIQCLAMDTDLSPAEILVKIALTMIRGCGGQEEIQDEREAILEFFGALQQKAVEA